jgi:hypothetical protein
MEPLNYDRHSVLNLVDLIISGKDKEVITILRELQQEYKTKPKENITN